MKNPKRYRADAQIGEALYHQMQDYAQKNNIKPSDITREALTLFFANHMSNDLTLSKKVKVFVTDYDKELLRVKSAVSNNINQMAKVLNIARLNGEVNNGLVEKVQRQLHKMLDVMLKGSVAERLEQ